MQDRLLILAHVLTTLAKLLGPGGAEAMVADSLLMKQQLLIINRSRQLLHTSPPGAYFWRLKHLLLVL
jgi:hypothetical protein